jgi:hypothetical protein
MFSLATFSAQTIQGEHGDKINRRSRTNLFAGAAYDTILR